MGRVTLKAGNSVAMLAPEVGGGIASLILAGHEILRRESDLLASSADPQSLGEFPMAPWVNRVANGRFTWHGREISVAEGPGHDPQGLHGIAWRRPWSVLERSDNAATLCIDWGGGSGWPFAFRFTRRFVLGASGFGIEARLTNLGPHPMPAALGFHPYFYSRDAILRAQTSKGWVTDSAGLPAIVGLESVAVQMRSGLAVDRVSLDNCFAGWDGVVAIDWPTHSLTMRTDPALHFLQIYSPAGAGYFCVEPQSAMPDAFNRDPSTGGFRTLAVGAGLSVSLYLSVVPVGQAGLA